jgi:hypothetical protein
MGPLEEGDQALVDAVRKISVGDHVAEQDDVLRGGDDKRGIHTRVRKNVHQDEHPEEIRVYVQTDIPDSSQFDRDGSKQGDFIIINKETGDIDADYYVSPTLRTKGGEGGNSGYYSEDPDGRAKAQQAKLKIAQRLGAATQRLIDGQVEDPRLARKMAEGEKEFRERVVKRNKGEDVGDFDRRPVDIERANRGDLESAEHASQYVLQEDERSRRGLRPKLKRR